MLVLGHLLAERYEGRGIVSRALRAVIDTAAGELGIHRFEIRCVPANTRSRAVAARLGFTHEAALRDAMQIGDGFEDDEIHALLVDGPPARRSVGVTLTT